MEEEQQQLIEKGLVDVGVVGKKEEDEEVAVGETKHLLLDGEKMTKGETTTTVNETIKVEAEQQLVSSSSNATKSLMSISLGEKGWRYPPPPPPPPPPQPRQRRTEDRFNRLFVWGLNPLTSWESVKGYFQTFGLVKSVFLDFAGGRNSKVNLGTAFISFVERGGVERVLTYPSAHILDGFQLRVEDGRNVLTPCSEIFVGGLRKKTTEVDIKAYFQKFGNVRGVKMPRDISTGLNKGYAFVYFESGADLVVELLCSMRTHTINHKVVECRKSDYYFSGKYQRQHGDNYRFHPYLAARSPTHSSPQQFNMFPSAQNNLSENQLLTMNALTSMFSSTVPSPSFAGLLLGSMMNFGFSNPPPPGTELSNQLTFPNFPSGTKIE